MGRINESVKTNLGKMPVEDYFEIQAYQYGFDSYEELYRTGFRISGYEDIHPGQLRLTENIRKPTPNLTR